MLRQPKPDPRLEEFLANPIPIVADIPNPAAGLGFSEYAEALADAIRGGEPPQFTIGLYGAWGSGKSSLLAGIADNLDNDGGVLPVVFDAWRYERAEYIVVPLLHKISSSVDQLNDEALSTQVKRALAAVMFSLNFRLFGVGIDTKDIRENWEIDLLTPLDDLFARPFHELQRIPDILKGRRIAVLIDDLDRCSPENVVSVLQAINVVMDVPGFIFVLALDYEVLVEAVTTRYPHVSGHDFIQKIVQLPFRVPPLNVEDPAFLTELIPHWEDICAPLTTTFDEVVRDIAVLGLRANPRQVKRLINSFLVIERIVSQRSLKVSHDLIAALIGLQLRWPGHNQDFQDAVLAGDEEPFKVLQDETEGAEDGLARYAQRFFADSGASNEQLRTLLQLTAVVAPSLTSVEVVFDVGPASEAREQNREAFVRAIEELGFQRSPRSERLYYNPTMPDVRFVMGKHVVRFEKRTDDAWVLWESYLLSREIDLAVKVIAHPDQHFSNRR